MKFIFPKNYKYNTKILGFINYVTAIIDLIIGILLFIILNLFIKKLEIKIYIFISLFFPILLFSIFGTNGENIIDFIIYIYKFFKKRKIYFYKKIGDNILEINNNKIIR